MPRNQRSLQLTDLYARRLKAVVGRVEALADSRWNLDPDDFDGSYGSWRDVAVQAVSQAQRQNLRLTNGYLAAFLTSESGRRISPPSVDPEKYVGKSRDGRDLADAWDSPLIKAKVAVKDGHTPEEASDIAKAGALALVGLDAYYGARGPMAEQMRLTAEVIGFRRVTVGATCGACLGAATGTVLPVDTDFHIHPSCDCVSEPVVKNVPDTAKRKTGDQIFNELTPAEQNARLGDEAAEAVRNGDVNLTDLVGQSPMATEPDFITQKPLSELL